MGGTLDGIVIQSHFWDIANRWDENGHQLDTQARSSAQFLQGWERNTSTYLDALLPYLRAVNGDADGKKAPWIAWRTVNTIDKTNDGSHWTSSQAQQQLDFMNSAGAFLARQKQMDILPFHMFPGAEFKRDRVHPNVCSSATIIEYAVRAIRLLQSGQNKTNTVPVADQLAIMHASYGNVSLNFNSWIGTLRSYTQRVKMMHTLGWTAASKDTSWKKENHLDWEHQLSLCHAGQYGPSFRSCSKCPVGKNSVFGSLAASGCRDAAPTTPQ
jgi:hypothetical protein